MCRARRDAVHVLDKRQYVTIAVFLGGLVFRPCQTDRTERAETAFHLDHHRPIFPSGPEIETVAATIGIKGDLPALRAEHFRHEALRIRAVIARGRCGRQEQIFDLRRLRYPKVRHA